MQISVESFSSTVLNCSALSGLGTYPSIPALIAVLSVLISLSAVMRMILIRGSVSRISSIISIPFLMGIMASVIIISGRCRW